MKKAVLLFSGGVDSTYAAVKMAEKFDKLFLITYKTPGMINAGFSKKSYNQIKRIFGKKVSHRIIDISKFVNSIRGGAIKCIKDNFDYKFYYSWCLGCKSAMNFYMVKFCKQNKINLVIDASNYYDIHALEQHKEVKNLFKRIYKDNKIEFISPFYYDKELVIKNTKIRNLLKHLSLYKDVTEKKIKFLNSREINLGRGFKSQYRATQPSCIISPIFNFVRLPLKLIREEKKEGYLEYIKDKYEKYKRFI